MRFFPALAAAALAAMSGANYTNAGVDLIDVRPAPEKLYGGGPGYSRRSETYRQHEAARATGNLSKPRTGFRIDTANPLADRTVTRQQARAAARHQFKRHHSKAARGGRKVPYHAYLYA